MFMRTCGYLFAVVCCATLILNYVAMKSVSNEDELNGMEGKLGRTSFFKALNYSSGPGYPHPKDMHVRLPEALALDKEAWEKLYNCSSGNSSAEYQDAPQGKVLKEIYNKEYVVYKNYVSGASVFGCNESVTYTTHGDYRYLDNLVPLAERWEGPVSIAVYAPGTDFRETVQRIRFLRECGSSLVKEIVTFHLFFDSKFEEVTAIPDWDEINGPVNCTDEPKFGQGVKSFRSLSRLTYPVNVARNIARLESRTHFLLASDIELYPSVGIIPQFLEMVVRKAVRRRGPRLLKENREVYVLPLFEVEEDQVIPRTKDELQVLLKSGLAVPFHKYVCPECHLVPKYKKWSDAPYSGKSFNVFHVAKRQKPFEYWEPIYIGTNAEPLYDDRLSWEGLRDKMSQGYAMCILDYRFKILDNAFLVHRPGIKKEKHKTKQTYIIRRQNRLIEAKIAGEIQRNYGTRKGCYI